MDYSYSTASIPLGYSYVAGSATYRHLKARSRSFATEARRVLGTSTFNVGLVPDGYERHRRDSWLDEEEEAEIRARLKDPDLALFTKMLDARNPTGRKTFAEGACVVVPDSGTPGAVALSYWEAFTMVCIMIAAIATPLTVSLFPSTMPLPAWSHFFERLLDVVFIMDMVLQFFIAYPVSPHGESPTVYASADWITNPLQIAQKYCQIPTSLSGHVGWFWIDICAVIPGLVFFFEVCFRSASPNVGERLAFLQCVRMLRMAKAFRVWRLVKVWQIHGGVSWFSIDLITFMTISLVACHWMACAWIAGALYYDKGNSWVTTLVETRGNPCGTEDVLESPGCMYMLASYWAVMTLTSVGYGDITPTNWIEYLLCTLLMLLCGYVWAYVVASVVNVLSNTDKHGVAFKQTLDDLNMFMDEQGLPQRLRRRIRTYVEEGKYTTRVKANANLVHMNVSPGLQREISRCGANVNALDAIYWAKDMQEAARLALISALECCFWAPYEECRLTDKLMVVDLGFAAVKGIILRQGDAFGHENMLLTNLDLKESAIPRSLTFVAAFTLALPDLLKVAAAYPALDRRLRRAQIKVALYRKCCILVGEAVRTKRLATTLAAMDAALDTNPEVGNMPDPTQRRLKNHLLRTRMRWSTSHLQQDSWLSGLSSNIQDMIEVQANLTKELLEAAKAQDEREQGLLSRLSKVEERMENAMATIAPAGEASKKASPER